MKNLQGLNQQCNVHIQDSMPEILNGLSYVQQLERCPNRRPKYHAYV